MPDISRWTAKRKIELIVKACGMSPNEITALLTWHDVSEEEFARWKELLENGGPPALRSTAIQTYR